MSDKPPHELTRSEMVEELHELSRGVLNAVTESARTGTILLEQYEGGPTALSDAAERMADLFVHLDVNLSNHKRWPR